MQVTVTDTVAALVTSRNGDEDRPSRVLITVVGAGTLYVDTVATGDDTTMVPLVEGQFAAEVDMRAGEVIYARAGDGESVDVRIMPSGSRVIIGA